MKIRSITVWQLDLPLKKTLLAFWWAAAVSTSSTPVFVRIETDSGIVGWGEATPWGHTYLPAHGPGVRAGIETLAGAVLGLDPCGVEQVERAMDLCLPGHLYAKAPIDMACWDIMGQVADRSIVRVADLLAAGRQRRQRRLSPPQYPPGEPEAMLALIDELSGTMGYRVHSAKVGAER